MIIMIVIEFSSIIRICIVYNMISIGIYNHVHGFKCSLENNYMSHALEGKSEL